MQIVYVYVSMSCFLSSNLFLSFFSDVVIVEACMLQSDAVAMVIYDVCSGDSSSSSSNDNRQTAEAATIRLSGSSLT